MKRARLMGTLAGVGTVATFVGARYARIGFRQCHPRRVRLTKEQRAAAQRQIPDLEEVVFHGTNGVELPGWVIPPRNGRLVVYAHGLGQNRMALFPQAAALRSHGYGALLFDSRGHGDSGGTTATWGELEALDVRHAVTFVLHRRDTEAIAVTGFSVGSSAAAAAAAEDDRIRAVILQAPWSSLRDEVAYEVRNRGAIARIPMLLGYRLAGVHVERVAPIQQVPAIAPRPVLLISGLKDANTPPAVVARVFEAAQEPKEIWYVPNATHTRIYESAPGEYEVRVKRFLDAAFAS